MTKKHVRTELENHIIDHFSKVSDWQDSALNENEHILTEFYESYTLNKDAFVETPEDEELIDEFVRIVGADIEGTYEFNAKDNATVIKALEKLGL